MGHFSNHGMCRICEVWVQLTAEQQWFRDRLLFSACGSIPRELAIFKMLKDYFPDYGEIAILESCKELFSCM